MTWKISCHVLVASCLVTSVSYGYQDEGQLAQAYTKALVQDAKIYYTDSESIEAINHVPVQADAGSDEALAWQPELVEQDLQTRPTPQGWHVNPYQGQPLRPAQPQKPLADNSLDQPSDAPVEIVQSRDEGQDALPEYPTTDAPAFELPLLAPPVAESVPEVKSDSDSQFEVTQLQQPFDETPSPSTARVETEGDWAVEETVIESVADSNSFQVPVETPVTQNEFAVSPERTAPSDSVLHRAVHHIEYGKSLARRSSIFAAKQEFYNALRLIAQSYDVGRDRAEYTTALKQAIVALREAQDFQVTDSETQISLDLGLISENHQTQVIARDEARRLTTISAMQRYLAYAHERMLFASGNHPVAAEAMYCLGKLHTVIAKNDPGTDPLNVAKAIVFHRTSFASDSGNYRAAHELGALMARTGQLNQAKEMFKESLKVNPTPHGWKNLAVVHQRLGEAADAQQAASNYTRMMQMPSTSGQIVWMEPEQFNQTAPRAIHETVASRSPDAGPSVKPKKQKNEKENFFDKLKKVF